MIEVEIYAHGWLYAWKFNRTLFRTVIWRALRRGRWGDVHTYTAEHVGCPHRMGSGWTKNRAQRDVGKICMEQG